MTDREKLFEWAIYLQSLRCFFFSFLFFVAGLFLFFFFSSSMLQFSLFFLFPVLCCWSVLIFFIFAGIFLKFLLVSRSPSKCCILLTILSLAVCTIVYSGSIPCHDGVPGVRHHIWICNISYACRNIVNTIMTQETQFFRKIYLSHFIRNCTRGLRKGYVWKVSWRLNKDFNI